MRLERFEADDGQEIRVQKAGHGPAIVLYYYTSGREPPRVGANRTPADGSLNVYRWDARGHCGHGDPHPPASGRPVSVERMADDLANLLDHFRLDRPVIVGHSMGALTPWAYIARHGWDRLGGIGIIDQSPRLITDGDWRLGIYGDAGTRRATGRS